MNKEEIELEKRLSQYSFYHTIELTKNVKTKGIAEYRPTQEPVLRIFEKTDFHGKRVLDVGCRDGMYSFEAERRGAASVLAIDNCISRGAIEVLIPHLGSKVEMRERNLLELTPQADGKFDIIIFAGVLYHLRYPFWSLKVLGDLLSEDGEMIIETAVMLNDPAVPLLYCPTEEASPYEPTSVTFFNLRGLRDTLASLGLSVAHLELLNFPELVSQPPRLGLKDRVKRFLGRTPDRIIDRATAVVRRSSASTDSRVSQYWNAKHDLE